MNFNTFSVVSAGLLYALAGLCFFLPFKAGKRTTAWWILWALLLLTSIAVFGDLSFLAVFILPFLLAFQFVFICYWTFRLFKYPKLGVVSARVLTCIFAYVALSPWIEDWTFSKKDARKILTIHQVYLQDDFEIVENNANGFRDYYHTIRLKISGRDFSNIANRIRKSSNFLGLCGNPAERRPPGYIKFDTIGCETEYTIQREYWTMKESDDGTFHFRVQLSKADSVLSFIGSNE